MIRSLAAGILVALAVQIPLLAGEDPPKPTPEDSDKPAESAPVEIQADQIQSKDKDFTFTGNVVVTRGKTRMNCQRMDGTLEDVETVDPDTQEKATQKQITRLIAQGEVKVYEDNSGRRATCERAEYDVRSDKIVMTGTPEQRPRVWDGDTITEADKIIFLLREDRVIWENESGRPVKFILPGSSINGKKDKDKSAKPPP